MRSLVDKIIKNPQRLFITILSCLVVFLFVWYFLFYKNISEIYSNSKNLEKNVSRDLKKYKGMQSQITAMESDWNTLNSEFQFVIERIPDKRLYENVTDYLYSDILKNGLKIIDFSPSNIAIEKENIFLPESDEEILVEKIPIDITLRGSFIDFNQFLEKIQEARYRFTTSDVGVSQSKSSPVQTIELIAYAYFQSSKNKTINKPKKIQKNEPIPTKKNKSPGKKIKNESDIKKVDVNVGLDDNIEDVPEMWLEPATEPIDELTEQLEKKKEIEKNTIPDSTTNKSEKPKTISKKEEPKFTSKNYNDLSALVVLASKMCKKVKNNLPINISEKFEINDEKVICHTLVNNNTEKNQIIYHIWYMNGELKAKVRIRVRSGKEIPAISNRKVNDLDVGAWKVVITDKNKMILDTVIFEVV